jgi:hypothetical protein
MPTELGRRPLAAHCHFGLDTLYSGSNQARGEDHLATVTTMDRELGTTFWLERRRRPSKRPAG